MSSYASQPLSAAVTPAKQSARRHYGSHPYFTKRAWNVVQAYIRHFSSPGDTVLDPFGGSGVTAVEALVLRRKAVYVDISRWATFLARQTAIAPVNIIELRESREELEDRCREYLQELSRMSDAELEKTAVRDWYPKRVRLPENADVEFVEELFTPRMLHGLAHLRTGIMECSNRQARDLLLMAFSATLARINRTFLSAANRKESRGGSSVFSIYRYKVAQRPVELPLWDQFRTRVDRLLQAKRETNELIEDFYQEGDTARFLHGSATKLIELINPQTIDYIYTDPPYGGHIAYLDLSTMWAAWLGFEIAKEDRAEEVIEGGQLKKSRADYQRLLAESVEQMFAVLKPGAWLSMVYAHRDTSYWGGLVDACNAAGFQYVNTVVQPVGVVWSMHKKKNPLRVLSGELVLNFRKPSRGLFTVRKPAAAGDALTVVRTACEELIVSRLGASTEELHHHVIPRLLEAELMPTFARKHGDLVSVLSQWFVFDAKSETWQLGDDHQPHELSDFNLDRYRISRVLERAFQQGEAVTQAQILRQVNSTRKNRRKISRKTVERVLAGIGSCVDGRHWLPRNRRTQLQLF